MNVRTTDGVRVLPLLSAVALVAFITACAGAASETADRSEVTGCVRIIQSRHVLNELAQTGHELPKSMIPRQFILRSRELARVRVDQHVGQIVAVTGTIEPPPEPERVPTLWAAEIRIVSDTCQF